MKQGEILQRHFPNIGLSCPKCGEHLTNGILLCGNCKEKLANDLEETIVKEKSQSLEIESIYLVKNRSNV